MNDGFDYLIGNGHGSVEVLDGTGGGYYYITWMGTRNALTSPAADDLGFLQIQRDGQFVPNPQRYNKHPSTTYWFQDDVDLYEGRLGRPRVDCVVPVAEGPNQLFGVRVNRMVKFWKKLMELDPGDPARCYSLLSTHQNCDAVVVDALLAGGLGWYEPPPGNLVYQDGRTLLHWVQKAARRITEMNAQHREIMGTLEVEKWADPSFEPDRTVPTYQEWKKESEKGIAWYGQRKMQIAFIDDHLKEYWRARAKNPPDEGAMMWRLFNILWYACEHRKHKPKSDRREAVVSLVTRAHCALEDMFKALDRRPVVPLGPPPELPPFNPWRK
jgi:hypothetical protein